MQRLGDSRAERERSDCLSPIALAAILEANRDALLERWERRVLDDPGMPLAPTLSRPALHDHVPEIVACLVKTLRTFAERPEELGRLVGSAEEAQEHVRDRVAAEYSVPEVLRELSHLRLAIVELCEETLPDRPAAAILHAAFDQMMINAADELSRIARGARRQAEALAAKQTRLYRREREARQACEEAHRAKDQFLAMVSHELRTPLNAIAGWAQMLKRRDSDPHMRERAIATIERNAQAQAHLIDGLLDFTRLRSGRSGAEFARVDLVALLGSVLESFAPPIAEKKLRVDCPLLPAEYFVDGDEPRLRQVFVNLLGNAIKFTPENGSIRVGIEFDAGSVQVEVTDSGIGIPDKFLPEVFEPFRQADASWTRRHNGLGLGLAIAKAIVELHRGTIEAHSDGPGRGATFRVRLPVTSSEHPDAEAAAVSVADGLAASSLDEPLEGVRVLVVDDDEDARSLTAAMLTDRGCQVREAASAAEAFALFRQFAPDVLATDLAMPDEDGVSLLQRVRAAYGRVPALAISAFSGPREMQRVLTAGFDAHVTKPIALGTLIAAVTELAGHAERKSRPTKSRDAEGWRSVLLVEDDVDVASDVAELLREQGYAVRLAKHGAEAWSHLEAGFRPNVILLDLLMPVMDGWTLRRKLLARPGLASIPVVVLTGVSSADAGAIERVEGIINKPFDFQSLLTMVNQHARSSAS